jgi:ferredoxin
VNWICNCCGCCCDGLLSYKRLGYQLAIHSNFLAEIDHELCNGCGICEECCPVDAISLVEGDHKHKYAEVDWNKCVGCGVCARFCKTDNILIKRKNELNFTPVDNFERYVRNAIETGNLPNYLLENFDLWTYDILRKFLSIIVSLSPVKKILALDQVQSRFLQLLVRTSKYDLFDRLYNEGRKVDYSHPELKTAN